MDIKTLYQSFLVSRRISTDTRQITPGSLFFALRGPNYDANSFGGEALAKGAALAVVDDIKVCIDDRYVLVDDTLAALQQLARHHRMQLEIPVIALTGSNGKTTTKEMLHTVLSRKYDCAATKGNLNNHIGVPLTILDIRPASEIAVIEMGANHVGEIAALCDIARPTHGLITNIGRAHIGTFGGAENILRAKSELYNFLLSTDGKVFINSHDPILANMAKRFSGPFFYPAPGDYFHCELLDADPYVRILTENGKEIVTNLTGNYNFENIAAALCVGKFFGVAADEAAKAIAAYVPGNMRSQIMLNGSNRIILDAYNANPSSMEAAIKNLATMRAEYRVAILGDMYELGDQAEREHQKLGLLLQEAGIEEAFFCGTLIKSALETFPSGKYFDKQDDLMEFIKRHPIRDATVLIKASRGMKMERVIEVL